MGEQKPRMFVGCSTENLELAYAIQENFEHEFEATVWNQGLFQPSQTALESLLPELSSYDLAVFAFAPDDVTKIRAVSATQCGITWSLNLASSRPRVPLRAIRQGSVMPFRMIGGEG